MGGTLRDSVDAERSCREPCPTQKPATDRLASGEAMSGGLRAGTAFGFDVQTSLIQTAADHRSSSRAAGARDHSRCDR